MAFNIGEILLSALTPVLESVGESKLVDLLQQLHDHHPETYQSTIKSGYLFAKQLQTVVTSSTSKIDDAIVQAIVESIEASALANNVTLP